MSATLARVRSLYLADRGDRLQAALVDFFTLYFALLFTGINGPPMARWIVGLSVSLPLLAAQVYLLTNRGQTIGKRLCGLRIVRPGSESVPGFARTVLMRYALPGALSLGLLSWSNGTDWAESACMLLLLADPLFIFTPERRCLHDWLAGTQVVRVR